MARSKRSQPSSMERRIAARKNPKFEPTDEQIEKAGEAARNAYGGNLAYSESTRWECAAEAALRTLPSGWRPANTAPEEEAVFVCDEEGQKWIAYRKGAVWFEDYEHSVLHIGITHWMPLPSLPDDFDKKEKS